DGVVETLSNPRFDPAPARTPSDRLRSIAHLSSRITENLFTTEGDDRDLEGLLKALQTTLEIRPEEGVRLVEISYRKAREVSGLFGLVMEAVRPQPEAGDTAESAEPMTLRSRVRSRLERIYETADRDEAEPPAPPGVPAPESVRMEGNATEGEEGREREAPVPVPAKAAETEEVVPRAVLQLKFLQEISQHLFGNQDINVLFNMILEGIHRGVGFDRALLSLLNPKKTRITGRYSLGSDGEDVAKQLDLANEPGDNVFGKAFAERQPCFISDADAGESRPLVPEVVRNVFKAGAFVISPIHAQGNVIGFFYADKAASGAPITPEDYQSFLHFTLQANLGLERLMTAPRK
ncbi:MAG: GAF domain-containing protein, partial [Nitrospirae bacterium]|nr:GAF domain-containing protein [Nitrospirota bacterium]